MGRWVYSRPQLERAVRPATDTGVDTSSGTVILMTDTCERDDLTSA